MSAEYDSGLERLFIEAYGSFYRAVKHNSLGALLEMVVLFQTELAYYTLPESEHVGVEITSTVLTVGVIFYMTLPLLRIAVKRSGWFGMGQPDGGESA